MLQQKTQPVANQRPAGALKMWRSFRDNLQFDRLSLCRQRRASGENFTNCWEPTRRRVPGGPEIWLSLWRMRSVYAVQYRNRDFGMKRMQHSLDPSEIDAIKHPRFGGFC